MGQPSNLQSVSEPKLPWRVWENHTKDKQSRRRSKTRKERWHKAKFLSPQPILDYVGNDVELDVGEIDRHGDEAADNDAHEDCAGFADVEAVHYGVDEGEDLECVRRWLRSRCEQGCAYLEERVVDSVSQGCVHIDEQDRGIFDRDLDRLDDGFDDQITKGHASSIDLGLGSDLFVSREFAETSGTIVEDCCWLGFWEEKEE